MMPDQYGSAQIRISIRKTGFNTDEDLTPDPAFYFYMNNWFGSSTANPTRISFQHRVWNGVVGTYISQYINNT